MTVRIKRSEKPEKPKKDTRRRHQRKGPPPSGAEELLALYARHSDPELLAKLSYLSEPESLLDGKRLLDKDAQEARLVMMHRMIQRGMTPEEIYTFLKISRIRYYQLLNELKARIRVDAERIDVPHYIGDSLHLYNDVRAMALMASTNPRLPAEVQIAAAKLALMAENDKNQFLSKIGIYSEGVLEKIVRQLVQSQYNPGKQKLLPASDFFDKLAHALSGKETINQEAP